LSTAYDYRVATLPNGLTVVTVEMPHLHSTQLSMFVRVGSRHETKETNGLSHFYEHMIFRGCEDFEDSTSLNSAMEDLGGTLDGYTMRDLTGYQSAVHPDFTQDALDIFAAMFRAPSYPDIDVERRIIIEEMLDALDDRGRVVDLDTIAHREAFKGHPLGQPIDGTKKNIRAFSVEHLEKHRRKFYGAKNMVLTLAGRFDRVRCLRSIDQKFGKLPPGKLSSETAPKIPLDAPRFAYVKSDDAQTRMRVSFRTTADTHEDHTTLLMLRRYLDGGFSGRLQVELVERTGLAYEVGADLEAYSDCGLFDFEFAVAHSKLIVTLETLFRLLGELKTKPVSHDELERLRRRARIGLEFGLDSAADLSHWFGATHLFREPRRPEERIAELDAVTPEKLQAAVVRYFRPDQMTVAAVGGADEVLVRSVRKRVRELVGSM
jgi:predicted Zn-dependent peptidase